jgi:hypothetical protein
MSRLVNVVFEVKVSGIPKSAIKRFKLAISEAIQRELSVPQTDDEQVDFLTSLFHTGPDIDGNRSDS